MHILTCNIYYELNREWALSSVYYGSYCTYNLIIMYTLKQPVTLSSTLFKLPPSSRHKLLVIFFILLLVIFLLSYFCWLSSYTVRGYLSAKLYAGLGT